MNYEHMELVQTLRRCAEACKRCIGGCLQENDINPMRECIRLDLDCAAICDLVAEYVGRGSAFSTQLLHHCSVICNTCATECEQHRKMEHCRLCAEACFACANACEEAVAQSVHV